jgi:hypothetical protein
MAGKRRQRSTPKRDPDDLRDMMRETAEEFTGRPGRVVAEINTTSEGFVLLVVMDPRTGYYRDFFMGNDRPLAERVSFAIRTGQKVQLPDGYVVEPPEDLATDEPLHIRRE